MPPSSGRPASQQAVLGRETDRLHHMQLGRQGTWRWVMQWAWTQPCSQTRGMYTITLNDAAAASSRLISLGALVPGGGDEEALDAAVQPGQGAGHALVLACLCYHT